MILKIFVEISLCPFKTQPERIDGKTQRFTNLLVYQINLEKYFRGNVVFTTIWQNHMLRKFLFNMSLCKVMNHAVKHEFPSEKPLSATNARSLSPSWIKRHLIICSHIIPTRQAPHKTRCPISFKPRHLLRHPYSYAPKLCSWAITQTRLCSNA